MRNAKSLTFTYTVGDEVVFEETVGNASKTCYRSAYGQIVPWIYSWYGFKGFYDFAGLESGTEVLLTIKGAVDFADGGDHELRIPITVDTMGPQLVKVTELPQEDGSHYLMVEAADEVDLSFAQLTNSTGTRVFGEAVSFETTENGTKTAIFDITDMGTEFMLALCDFAANESYYALTYTSADDHIFSRLMGLPHPFLNGQQVGRQVKEHLHRALQCFLPLIVLDRGDHRIAGQTLFQFKCAQCNSPNTKTNGKLQAQHLRLTVSRFSNSLLE